MRGHRIPKASRKLDVVIVAARYSKSGKKLDCGKAYVRRGPIWSDIQLLDRKDLIQRLEDKQCVVTGRPTEIPGEFEVFNHLLPYGQDEVLTFQAHEMGSTGDDLGLPLF